MIEERKGREGGDGKDGKGKVRNGRVGMGKSMGGALRVWEGNSAVVKIPVKSPGDFLIDDVPPVHTALQMLLIVCCKVFA